MTNEIIKAESNYATLCALFDAYKVICTYYEQLYGGYIPALQYNKDFAVLRDSKNRIWRRMEELKNGIDNQGSSRS